MSKKQKIKIFYSYSHKDEKHRKSLETHLSLMSRNEVILEWHDRKISAGQEWEKEIDNNIKSSDIILLFVSSDFIASDYCYENEMKLALLQHEQSTSIVIPIIIRPSNWSETPFSKLQALPSDAKPVTTWGNEDEAWLNVAEGIKAKVNEVIKGKFRQQKDSGFHSSSDLLKKAINDIDSAFRLSFEDDKEFRGFSTGIHDLDYHIDGISHSELTVIAARPEMKPDMLSLQIMRHITTTEKIPTALFSLNTSAEKIMRNFLGAESHLEPYIITKGNLYEEHWPMLALGATTLKNAPIHIDDSTTSTLDDIIHKGEAIIESDKVRLIIIDNLQNLYFNEQKNGGNKSLDEISKGLKTFAREKNISIILTCNLDKKIINRPNKRPIWSDMLDFGSLYEDAGTVIFIYRDDVYNDDNKDKSIAELIIEKNSQMESTEVIYTQYLKKYSIFQNIPKTQIDKEDGQAEKKSRGQTP